MKNPVFRCAFLLAVLSTSQSHSQQADYLVHKQKKVTWQYEAMAVDTLVVVNYFGHMNISRWDKNENCLSPSLLFEENGTFGIKWMKIFIRRTFKSFFADFRMMIAAGII
jgi:hypothetical protein